MYNGLSKTSAKKNISKGGSDAVDGLLPYNGHLDGLRDNEDLIDTTEVQLDATRKSLHPRTLEAALSRDSHTGELHEDGRPLAKLNEEQETARSKAYSRKLDAEDTSFWDDYVGVKRPTPVVASSLASLDDGLFRLYLASAVARRELSRHERFVVAEINRAKETVLAQAIPHDAHLADRIEQLQGVLRNTPPNSPEHDRVRAELDAAVEAARRTTSPAASGERPPAANPSLAAPQPHQLPGKPVSPLVR